MAPSGPFGLGHFRGPGGLRGEARLCAVTVEACRPAARSEDGTAACPFESLSALRGTAGVGRPGNRETGALLGPTI